MIIVKDVEKWHLWFAWRPIFLGKRIKWFQTVWRRKNYYVGDNWGNTCSVPYWEYKKKE